MGIIALLAFSACQTAGTRPIIKLGLSAPFTGEDESVGYSVIGAVRLAIRERNLAGGVAGYSVELVALDDGNLPDMAAQKAREMIVDPAVMAVLGGFDVPAAQAAATEYASAGMAFAILAPGEDTPALQGFHLSATEAEAGRRAAVFARQTLKARQIVVVSDETPGSVSLAAVFSEQAQANGVAIAQSRIARWQLDFAATVQQIASAAPDLVFFAGRALEAGELLKQMRTAGIIAPFLGGPEVDDARLGQIAGQAAQGAYDVSAGYSLPQVTDEARRADLLKAGLQPAGAYTVSAYDGTRLLLDALAQAIKAQGKPSRQAVAGAVQHIDFHGLSGEISFDGQGDRRNPPVNVYMITDGAYPGELVQ